MPWTHIRYTGGWAWGQGAPREGSRGPAALPPAPRRAPVPPARCPRTAAAALPRHPGRAPGSAGALPRLPGGSRLALRSVSWGRRGGGSRDTGTPGRLLRYPAAAPGFPTLQLPPVLRCRRRAPPGSREGSSPCPAPTRGPRALPWQPVAPEVLEAVNNALRVTAMALFSGGGRCQESRLGGERPNLTQCCKVPKPNERVFPEQKKKPENRRRFLQTLPIY